jgi:hypothetical protein
MSLKCGEFDSITTFHLSRRTLLCGNTVFRNMVENEARGMDAKTN